MRNVDSDRPFALWIIVQLQECVCVRTRMSTNVYPTQHLFTRIEDIISTNTVPTATPIRPMIVLSGVGCGKVSNISTAGSLQHLVIALDIDMITV